MEEKRPNELTDELLDAVAGGVQAAYIFGQGSDEFLIIPREGQEKKREQETDACPWKRRYRQRSYRDTTDEKISMLLGPTGHFALVTSFQINRLAVSN